MNVDKNGQPLPAAPLSASFVDGLQEPLLSIARECIPSSPLQLPPAAERADRLQIQLRSHLLTLVHESLSTDDAALQSNVGIFWNGSLELCLHLVYFSEQQGSTNDERYTGMSVRKLPLVLLEDALDALPLQSFLQMWEAVVEPALCLLFSKLMWYPTPTSTPCALPFIKLCNKFQKTLSVQPQTGGTWPGRILQTLAAAFPLSDKSATKIWGSFHTENVTEFESKTIFEQQKVKQKQQQQDVDDDEDMGMMTKQQTTTNSFSFYETFWSVQKDFSNPSGIKVADFLERMKTILAALESHPLIRKNKNDTNASTTTTTNPVKYLTSSHLLPIQLGDPEFRIHFLTQFLIVEHHLSAESPALGNAMAPMQSRAVELLKSIPNYTSNTSLPATTTTKNSGGGGGGTQHWEILEFILRYRETYWRQWKKNKCQFDMEEPLVKRTSSADNDDEVENGKKRKRLDGSLGEDDDAKSSNKAWVGAATVGATTATTAPPKKKKDEEELLIDFILDERKNLKATCALQIATPSSKNANATNSRSTVIPSLEEHLETYVDALDPDAGIEAEYHPKNNSLFTWRALRLLSRDHLGKFHMINHKGDFEKMVRTIYSEEKGIQIAGEFQEEEEAVFNDDDVAMVDENTKEAIPEDEENNKKLDDTATDGNGQGQDLDLRDESQPTSPMDEGGDRPLKDEYDTDSAHGKNDAKHVKRESGDEENKNSDKDDESLQDDSGDGDDDDNSDSDSDEPRRMKVEILDSDEGEIEESKAGKSAEPTSPSPSPAEVKGQQPVKEDASKEESNPPIRSEPAQAADDRPVKEERKDDKNNNNNSGKNSNSNNNSGRNNKSRGKGGGSDRNSKSENRQQDRPSSPSQKGGSRGGRDRDALNNKQNDGPAASSYNSLADSRDNRERGPPRQQQQQQQQHGGGGKGGGGGDSSGRRGGEGNRDFRGSSDGATGGGGGGSSGRRYDDDRRGSDDRHDDRRGSGSRRDEGRRGGSGGGGDRRDRRGGGGGRGARRRN